MSEDFVNVAPSDGGGAEVESEQLGVEFWKTKYGQLEEHCKVVNEQKVGFLHIVFQPFRWSGTPRSVYIARSGTTPEFPVFQMDISAVQEKHRLIQVYS